MPELYFGDYPKYKEPKSNSFVCTKELCKNSDRSENGILASADTSMNSSSGESKFSNIIANQNILRKK